MKIQIYSDVHNEFGTFNPEPLDSDVVVLAGDIDNGTEGVKWAKENFKDKPVIYVPGNHEFYGGKITDTVCDLMEAAKNTNVHLLNNSSVIIDDVQFLGCTLWTDFNLRNDPDDAKDAAKEKMSDYVTIQSSEVGMYTTSYKKITPDEILYLHHESLTWLKEQITKPFDGLTVIVTHHAPCIESISLTKRGDDLNPAYASNLETFVSESGAAIWIHGHTHNNSDYRLGDTRVICNPRGYVPYNTNKNFKPEYIIEI